MDVASIIRTLQQTIQPMRTQSYDMRINFDGILWLTSSMPPGGTYIQLYRNGAIEAIEATLLNTRPEKTIPGVLLEKELILILSRCLEALGKLGFQPPLLVMLSLLGVKGFTLWDKDMERSGFSAIDRDLLLLPEKIVESYDEKADRILRSMFDGICPASGLAFCPNYDSEGNWHPRQV